MPPAFDEEFTVGIATFIFGINDYPPASYIRDAMSKLADPGPDVSPQTIEVDARPRWAQYRVTFVAKRNLGLAIGDYWFWAAESGRRL